MHRHSWRPEQTFRLHTRRISDGSGGIGCYWTYSNLHSFSAVVRLIVTRFLTSNIHTEINLQHNHQAHVAENGNLTRFMYPRARKKQQTYSNYIHTFLRRLTAVAGKEGYSNQIIIFLFRLPARPHSGNQKQNQNQNILSVLVVFTRKITLVYGLKA